MCVLPCRYFQEVDRHVVPTTAVLLITQCGASCMVFACVALYGSWFYVLGCSTSHAQNCETWPCWRRVVHSHCDTSTLVWFTYIRDAATNPDAALCRFRSGTRRDRNASEVSHTLTTGMPMVLLRAPTHPFHSPCLVCSLVTRTDSVAVIQCSSCSLMIVPTSTAMLCIVLASC